MRKAVTVKRYDKYFAILFAVLSVLLLVLAEANADFFHWAFTRHENQLSWYIRPLFLIPFCYFSYRRNLSGIAGTVFLLLTSMFWFPEPDSVNAQVKTFLDMEQSYLTGPWDAAKIILTLLVPVSLAVLSMAFWRRSIRIGTVVLILITAAKILWSLVSGGTSGFTVILPAGAGLFVCIIGIVLLPAAFRKWKKMK